MGIGRGFCSRLHAVEFAAAQAGERARGAVLGSDAFFPFPDGVEAAARAGVAAIIQPGGSQKDSQVFEAAERLGISMFISGTTSGTRAAMVNFLVIGAAQEHTSPFLQIGNCRDGSRGLGKPEWGDGISPVNALDPGSILPIVKA